MVHNLYKKPIELKIIILSKIIFLKLKIIPQLKIVFHALILKLSSEIFCYELLL